MLFGVLSFWSLQYQPQHDPKLDFQTDKRTRRRESGKDPVRKGRSSPPYKSQSLTYGFLGATVISAIKQYKQHYSILE